MAESNIKRNISIIEEGTETIGNIHWTYRKWSDGTAEAWGYISSYQVNCNSSYGYMYYGPLQDHQYFPTNLFIDTPIINITFISGDGLVGGIYSIVKEYFSYYPYVPNAGTHYIAWRAYLIGKWR